MYIGGVDPVGGVVSTGGETVYRGGHCTYGKLASSEVDTVYI